MPRRDSRVSASAAAWALRSRSSADTQLTSGRVLRRTALLFAAQLRMLVDELLDHAGIRERGNISQLIVFVGGNLSQDAAHDLSRTSLRQGRSPLNDVRRCDRTDFPAHPIAQLRAQRFGRLGAGDQRDVNIDALSFDVVRKSDHSGLSDGWMSHQSAFYFGGAQPVTGDIDDIVHSACDPVITVGIAARAIAREIHSAKRFEVRVDESLMVAVDGA